MNWFIIKTDNREECIRYAVQKQTENLAELWWEVVLLDGPEPDQRIALHLDLRSIGSNTAVYVCYLISYLPFNLLDELQDPMYNRSPQLNLANAVSYLY